MLDSVCTNDCISAEDAENCTTVRYTSTDWQEVAFLIMFLAPSDGWTLAHTARNILKNLLTVTIWQRQHYGLRNSFEASLGTLIIVDDNMDRSKYASIVADHIHPYMQIVFPGHGGTFQHDNATCHKARIICEWLDETNT